MTIRRSLLLFAFSLAAAACKKPEVKPVSPTPAPEPTRAVSSIRFEDVTKASGVAFTHVNGAAGKKWMPETMGSGVAAFDADGDGRIDLLFVNGRYWAGDPRGAAGQPKLAFYRNVTEPGGEIRFEDRTVESGLAISLFGMGVAVGDVNDDGFPDVVITGLDDIRLFLNDGKGHFRDATKGSGLVGTGWGTSAAFADFVARGVVDGEGKHSLEVVDHVASPARITLQECLGIARAFPIYVRPQLRAQSPVIIDFAVHHDHIARDRICHRLRAGRRKIDDRQSRVAQPAAAIRGRPFSRRVGAAMPDQLKIQRFRGAI